MARRARLLVTWPLDAARPRARSASPRCALASRISVPGRSLVHTRAASHLPALPVPAPQVTVVLAIGVTVMARNHAIVRQLVGG